MATFMSGLAARESGGGACPGRYLPVSTPWASGDQTIWEMPLAAHGGNSSTSGACQSIEYWGQEETNSSGHLALPEATTCWNASIVSSTGTSGSKRCAW
jgi:hypothetical protein